MSSPSEIHFRAFSADVEVHEEAAGLTVEGIVVPYDKDVPITEARDGRPVRYREKFVSGAFDRAVRTPDRVTLTYDHDRSVSNRLGFGRSFADSAEGLVGVFRLDRSTADKAREILTSSHAAFSIGFVSLHPRALTERDGDLVVRRSVHLDHVAAVSTPAYAGAGVSAIRGLDIDEDATTADLAAEAQLRADRELLAVLAQQRADQARWDALALNRAL